MFQSQHRLHVRTICQQGFEWREVLKVLELFK